MTENQLKITYKIFLEAEDIKGSRILSTKTFVTHFFENCKNVYLNHINIDDECDLEEYILRLYVDHEIEEECRCNQDAENFVTDMAEFLDQLAQAQSFLDMEGDFTIEFHGNREAYQFKSEEGQNYCEFMKI